MPSGHVISPINTSVEEDLLQACKFGTCSMYVNQRLGARNVSSLVACQKEGRSRPARSIANLEGCVWIVLNSCRHSEGRLEGVCGAVIHDSKLAIWWCELQKPLCFKLVQRHTLVEVAVIQHYCIHPPASRQMPVTTLPQLCLALQTLPMALQHATKHSQLSN